MQSRFIGLIVCLFLGFLLSCGGGAGSSSGGVGSPNGLSTQSDNDVVNVSEFRPAVLHTNYSTDALIYNGDFAAYDGPEAIADIAQSHGLSYRYVNSEELNQMSLEEVVDHGVIIWPGGYAGRQSNSLTSDTREKIRSAVNDYGVGFVGFCAGAFIAVSPDTSWGFSIIKDETLPYYYLEEQGIDKAMVTVGFADGSTRDLLWWGGPWVPEYPGGVIARYAQTGQPAISQAWAGNGLMIITGPHPEAPESWRVKLGLSDGDGLDQEIAWKLIAGALKQIPVRAF